nr:protein RST1 isoform X4 [Ipomoea trifida]
MMLCGGSDSVIIPTGVGGFIASRALSQRNNDPTRASRPWDSVMTAMGLSWVKELEFCFWKNLSMRRKEVQQSMLNFSVEEPHPEEKAIANSGVCRDDVNYINTHATSSQAGDLTEFQALRFFGQNPEDYIGFKSTLGFCAVDGKAWHRGTAKLFFMAGRTSCRDIFYAPWVPDLFMERVQGNGQCSLFCPNEAPGLADCCGEEFEELYTEYERKGKAKKVVHAQNLWFEILKSQIETGCLWTEHYIPKEKIEDIDAGDVYNELAVVEYAEDIYKFTRKLRLLLTTNLNKIIDVNFYPIETAKNSNLRHRSIGIGVQGRHIHFTRHRFLFTRGTLQPDMWGVTPSNQWDWVVFRAMIEKNEVRNSLLVAPMPTASTSQILGNNECFEPYTSNIYSRRVVRFAVEGVFAGGIKQKNMAADGRNRWADKNKAACGLNIKLAKEKIEDIDAGDVYNELAVVELGKGIPDNQELAEDMAITQHSRNRRIKGGTLLIVCPMALLGQWKDGGSSIFHKVDWYRIVLDEAHTIKSWRTMSARAAFTLSVHCRWSLTGTPLQNNVHDLYSLLCFLHVEPWCNWAWQLMLRRTNEIKDKEGRSPPRSAENIALGIGALCSALPLSDHAIKSTASKFLLSWLFQHEHEYRQWSAAISLGLISSFLHVTDRKQKVEYINALLERVLQVLSVSKSTLVKGACGVGLGFSCQDLLTKSDGEDNFHLNDFDSNITPRFLGQCSDDFEENVWGVAGFILGLGSSLGAIYRAGFYDAVLNLKTLFFSWIPNLNPSIPFLTTSAKSELLFSVGACLAAPIVMAFCHRVEQMDGTEIDQSLLMASCIGAGSLLGTILNGSLHSLKVEHVKDLPALFKKSYSDPNPPLIHLGATIVAVNALGAGAGTLIQDHPSFSSHATNNQKESSYINGPLLSSPTLEPDLTSLVQEIFLVAQNPDADQLQQYAAWAASFLRHSLQLQEHYNEATTVSGAGTKNVSHIFSEDSTVLKLSLWLSHLKHPGELQRLCTMLVGVSKDNGLLTQWKLAVSQNLLPRFSVEGVFAGGIKQNNMAVDGRNRRVPFELKASCFLRCPPPPPTPRGFCAQLLANAQAATADKNKVPRKPPSQKRATMKPIKPEAVIVISPDTKEEILADAMGLGRTVMTIALILAKGIPDNQELAEDMAITQEQKD